MLSESRAVALRVSRLMSAYGGKADIIGSLRAFPLLTPSLRKALRRVSFVDLVAAERLGVAFKAEARTEGVAMVRPELAKPMRLG